MFDGFWQKLSTSPVFWLTVTLVIWQVSLWIARLRAGNPLLNPILIAVILLTVIVKLAGVDYATYFSGGQFIHFLLGPATVALGIPLYEKLALVRENLVPIACALFIGSLTAVGSTILLGHILNFSPDVVVSMAPKSATTPVAMAISSGLHGEPALTAVFVILTGICGGVIITPLMNVMRIHDYSARGFAAGLAAHGIGTVRAYMISPVAGLFAGIAMGLNAIMTVLVVHFFL